MLYNISCYDEVGHLTSNVHLMHVGPPAQQVFQDKRNTIKSLSVGRKVIPPTHDATHLGCIDDKDTVSNASPIIDIHEWDNMQPEQLIDMVHSLQPHGQLAAAIQYAAPDLVWAEPLETEELAREYTAPGSEFIAGQGFKNRTFWVELAGTNFEVHRWVTEGYSELVRNYNNFNPIDQKNSPTTAKHADFVTAE